MNGRHSVRTLAISLVLLLSVHGSAAAQSRGTATFRERTTLPADAVFDATLEDVSQGGAAPIVAGGRACAGRRLRRSGSRSRSTHHASSRGIGTWCAHACSPARDRRSPRTRAIPC